MKANHKCCVFRPAFGCCAHPKAGRNTFFSRFQPFLFILNLFQWFHGWNQQKNVWKRTKKFFLLFFAYSAKLVDMQKLADSLRGVPQNCLFSVDFLLMCFCVWTRPSFPLRKLGTFAQSKLPFLWWGTSLYKMKSYLLEGYIRFLTELCL